MARPRLITDEQILRTMRAAVLQHGPSVSLDLVADALGVTSPALLKRFGSRQNLMIAALRPPDESQWVQPQPPDERPLLVQLEAMLTAYWEFLAQVVPCVMALRESGIDARLWRQPNFTGPKKAVEWIARWLTAAKSRGLVDFADAEIAASSMLGALQVRTLTAHLSRQSMATKLHRAYLHGLAVFFTDALAPRRRAPTTRQVRA
ncbi:MAG: TetR/AcrR family transcriptional regulator [Myxococcaceae bacterium]|nr:TetR/AcrR family transcriptional regulator [Myxococcaceae bacterium]